MPITSIQVYHVHAPGSNITRRGLWIDVNTSIDSEAEHSVVSSLPLIEHNAGLDTATFEDKLRYFDLLDVRGKLAFENNEKVVYIKCKAGKQRVSLAVTSHSSSTGAIAMHSIGFRSTILFR
jgi:hypothetical protein